MSVKKEDLRISRTHKLLSDAMFSLMETKCFDEISVIDICNKASVHRATFYKHFNDKNDFIEHITNEKLLELYQNSIKGMDMSDKHAVHKSIINTVTKFVEEHKNMFRLVASSSNVTYFNSTINIINASLVKYIKESEVHAKLQDPPTEVVGAFFTGGLIALLNWWITDGDKYSADDIRRYLESLILLDRIHPQSPFN